MIRSRWVALCIPVAMAVDSSGGQFTMLEVVKFVCKGFVKLHPPKVKISHSSRRFQSKRHMKRQTKRLMCCNPFSKLQRVLQHFPQSRDKRLKSSRRAVVYRSTK